MEGGAPKKMEEFYRLLDHQRTDWYNEQINDQSKEEDSKDNSTAKKAKQFDMFEEESSEDDDVSHNNLNDAVQK